MKKKVPWFMPAILLIVALAFVLSPTSVLADGWKHKCKKGYHHDCKHKVDPYDDQNGFFYGNDIFEALNRIADPENPDLYDPQDVCDYLWKPAIRRGPDAHPGGLFQQLQSGIRAFRNTTPDDLGKLHINKPEKTWKGFTLLSSAGGGVIDDAGTPTDPSDDILYRAALLDMDGNIIHGWTNVRGVPFKLYPGGHLMGGGEGGFGGRKMVIQDWCGNETWRWEGLPQYEVDENGDIIGPELDDEGNPVYNARQHHDFQLEGAPAGYYAPGVHPRNFTNPKTLTPTLHKY